MQGEGAAGFGGGAALREWAGAAQCTEGHAARLGDGAGVPGRATHGGGLLVDGEVVDAESAGDRDGIGLGLITASCPKGLYRATQIPCAVSGIAVPLPRSGSLRTVCGQELLGDRGIGVGRPDGHGQRLVGDDSGFGFGHHMCPVPVAARFR